MLNKMACMEAMLLFQGGLGLLDCIASWRGQERHVSHGEGTVPFFSTNRGDIHTNGENHGFWVCFFLGFTRTTTDWDGDGDGDGVGGRPAAKERRSDWKHARVLCFFGRWEVF